MGLDEHMISIVYLIFGVAAVSGGAFGGTLADKFGSTRIIPIFIVIYAAMIFATSYSTSFLPLFMIVLALWGLMSWSVTPAMQSYLMTADPDTADMQISISNSALHFGIAFGSFIGGITIDRAGVEINSFVGGLFVVLALATMSISLMQKGKKKEVNTF